MMQTQKVIDVVELFSMVLGDKISDFTLPPESFSVMQAEIIAFSKKEKTLITKMPVLASWNNPYGTMQGGFINAAIDNAVGPLSLLIAPANITRHMETKFLKSVTLETDYILVKASLSEMKKRRLSFEVSVEDEKGEVFVQAKVVNFIV